MRVERKGGSPDLQAAFNEFVVRVLAGRSLDDYKNQEAKLGKFPDFACFRDLVLLEMKHLETEQIARVSRAFEKKVLPDEKPAFYGQRPIDLSTLSNGPEVKAEIENKLAQTIETHLRKANHQFDEFRTRNPRKNSLSVCVLLNSRLKEFNPQLVLHSIHRKMKATGDTTPRFPHIDAVIYISEKHFQRLPDGRIAFGIGIFEGNGTAEQRWKLQVLDKILERWAHFRTGAPMEGGRYNGLAFNTIEDIPEKMRRSDAWRLAYKRNPYLAKLSDQQLKVYFNRCLAVNSLGLLKGNWNRPTREEMMSSMVRFTHALEEINRRGLDMRVFDPRLLSAEELEEVHVGLPKELVQILPKSGEN